MTKDFTRGSEWQKWDLQVHTPASELCNNFGNDWDLYVKSLFNKAIQEGIAVIGITDYYSIEGYKKILTEYIAIDSKLCSLFADELKIDSLYIEKVRDIKLLPNIEFRFKDIIDRGTSNCKIEGHIIFSDELSISDIENKFLAKINFLDTITPNNMDKTPLIRANIESFGKTMKSQQPTFSGSDYYVGMMCLVVDFEEIKKVLEVSQKNTFSGKYIFIIPEDDITPINWNSGAHQVRKKYYTMANGLFTINTKTIKWGLQETTKQEFCSFKPCFSCSDAHSIENLFEFKSNIPCWIKSNPTFAGLLQVLYQPTERIFLGDIPSKIQKVKTQPYYYFDRLTVKKNSNAKNSITWFDCDILLNPGLVAIIGNKGSGKSALADIIGYLVNSKNIENEKASFLTNKRFRKEDKKFADDYYAVLSWCDGDPIEKQTLSNPITEIQRAEYLPQKHIDDICNDLKNEIFQHEINKVVFSYIDATERLETTSLDALLAKKTASIDDEIMQCRRSLETTIKEYLTLIKRKTKKHQKEVSDILSKKKGELASHDKNKPAEVFKPTQNTALTDVLEKCNEALIAIDEKIKNSRSELAAVNIKISNIEQFIAKYEQELKNIAELNIIANEVAKESNINYDMHFSLTGCIDVFRNKLQELKEKRSILQNNLDLHEDIEIDETHEFLLVEKRNIEEQIKHNTLAAEDGLKKYQEYLKSLKTWQENRSKIEGDFETEGTIKFCEAELSFITNALPKKEADTNKVIFDKIKNLYDFLMKKITIYKDLYAPIEDKLSKILKDNTDKIKFETIFNINSDFCEKFLSKIKQNVDSEYKGISDGTAAIEKRIRECEFLNWTSFETFIKGIIDSLFSDVDKIEKLLKDAQEAFEYIAKLEYIKVQFSLKMDDKSLSELSPGQRGNVLLVFYLALNKKSEPLIIDQPEDNLDNQSVYNKLVPCILEAKKHRQVIIVTHNPNIAVACDAEQIICAHIEKTTNKITYISGAIENPNIKKHVVDILEGTMPAFELRQIKYIGEVRK